MPRFTEISNSIYCFANCFDLKDWDGLKNVLHEIIQCDYQDLRGAKKQYNRDDFVLLRKDALENLYTQHLFSNLEIKITGDSAECRATAFIMRKDKHDTQFNTHAVYFFKLIKLNEHWLISEIKQTVLWNEGDSKIHSGVKN